MKVLVLGGALCWRDDAREALRLFTPTHVYAANHVGILWPGRLDVWGTMHPDEMHRWRQERAEAGRNTDYEAATYLCADRKRGEHIDRYHDHVWDGQRNGGSSGFFVTKVALDDGATHVILAGIPLEASAGHIFRPGPWDAGQPTNPADSYQLTWQLLAEQGHLRRVRSMSGFTKGLLGAPTREWLATAPSNT